MSLGFRFLYRRAHKLQARAFSALSAENPVESKFVNDIHASESNPINQSSKDLNKIYVVPNNTYKSIFSYKEVPKMFREETEIFGESFFLVRKPALEILSYLKQTDFSRPINKYVLYGRPGTGKTRTLLHLLHYAFQQKFLLFHLPWPQVWFKFPKEVTHLEDQDAIDLPVEAGAWLQLFKNQNQKLLNELKLTLTKDYVWSERESAQEGASLESIIDFGISRIKYASNVIEALVHELKIASSSGKCKVFVAIDGYNAFLSDHTQIKNPEKKFVPADQITLTRIFTKVINADWCNGVAVITVDQIATKDRNKSELPMYLLGEKGFEQLDPFIPVEVQKYNDLEFEAIMEYYKERKFIRDITANGQQELKLISGCNPLTLISACKPL